MNQLKISIFFYDGYIDVSPTIINIIRTLIKHGHLVDVYTREHPVCRKTQTLGDGVKIFYIKSPATLPIFSNAINFLNKTKRTNLSTFLDFWGWVVFFALSRLTQKNKVSRGAEAINIGVDVYGASLAVLENFFLGKKLIYLSLELNEPTTLISRALNLIDRVAYQKSICLLIQDEDRFHSISKSNCYRHPKVFYLPNSPVIQLTDAPATTGNFFRKKLGINYKSFPYLILQAGAIVDECFSLTLAQAFSAIDPSRGYALIFHERFKREIGDSYIQQLIQVNSSNLFLSLEPLPYEEVDLIFEAATIGLAFYKSQGDNFSKIALASGKLAGYLKYGKPVLVNNLESLKNLVNSYDIGVVIEDPSNALEIQLGIDLILSNYELYQANARKCYEAEFNFETKVKPFLEFLDCMTDSHD